MRSKSTKEGKSKRAFLHRPRPDASKTTLGALTPFADRYGKSLHVGDRVLICSTKREGVVLWNTNNNCFSVFYGVAYPPFDPLRAESYQNVDRDLTPGDRMNLVRIERR